MIKFNNCSFCGKKSNKLVKIQDSCLQEHLVCEECKKSLDNNECRNCGSVIDDILKYDFKGLCSSCWQAYNIKKFREKEEAYLGARTTAFDELCIPNDGEMNENLAYQYWMTMKSQNKEFTPELMANPQTGVFYRRFWATTKIFELTACRTGEAFGTEKFTKAYNELAKEYLQTVIDLLDQNMSRILERECTLMICNTTAELNNARKLEANGKILAHSGAVYFLAIG